MLETFISTTLWVTYGVVAMEDHRAAQRWTIAFVLVFAAVVAVSSLKRRTER